MKILIADQFSDLGGAQRVLLETLPAWQREGWTAQLAIPGEGGLRKAAEALGVSCFAIPCGPFNLGGKSFADHVRFAAQFGPLRKQLRRLMEEFRPDLLYVNGPRLVPAACSLGKDSPPVVFHAHSYLKSRYLSSVTGYFLQRAQARVIANCQYVVEPLRRYLTAASVEVIYNGVPDFRSSRARGLGRGRVGVLGRISPDKGQRVFVEAARMVSKVMPQSSFLVVGGTQFSDLRSVAYLSDLRELARGAPVEFTEWREDVGSVLRDLDLLIVPSLRDAEATTRVIPEAFSAGVPVLASDLPGIREIVAEGETGFLFTAGDARALATRIGEILSFTPERMGAILDNARRAYEERFSLDVFHRRIINNLKRVGSKDLT